MVQTYGVAVHGAGWVAAEHVRAFAADVRARVVAISSRRAESAERVARETGHSDVLIETDLDAVLERDDVDVLAVCTPHDLHPENTIAAAQAGKHVLIEKPAALDLTKPAGDAGRGCRGGRADGGEFCAALESAV